MKLDLFYYEKHEGYTQSREESCDFFKDFSMDSLNPLSLLSFLFFEKYLRKVEHIFLSNIFDIVHKVLDVTITKVRNTKKWLFISDKDSTL